jgi:hypothetical protein
MIAPRGHLQRGLDERQRAKVKVARQSKLQAGHKGQHLQFLSLGFIYLFAYVNTKAGSFLCFCQKMNVKKFSVELHTRPHCLKS